MRASPALVFVFWAEALKTLLKRLWGENRLKKNLIKYLIDVTIFIDICSITIIGLLLGFVIPEGRGAYKYLFGLHRHEWGNIHLYLSIFLVVLLFFHVWFNRVWIVNSTKRYFGEKWKKILWIFSAGWVVVLFTGWTIMQFS